MCQLQDGRNAVLVKTARQVSQVEQEGGSQPLHEQREGELARCCKAEVRQGNCPVGKIRIW